MTITPEQCLAARALARVDQISLAQKAGLQRDLVEKFEIGRQVPDTESIAALRRALEELGVEFISENGGGLGVRLKLDQRQSRQISVWESEGGSTADDDVP